MATTAKVVDFWRDVLPTTCALCSKPRARKRRRWRWRYCSENCRLIVERYRQELLAGKHFESRAYLQVAGKPAHVKQWAVYRFMWIADSRGRLVLFDFLHDMVRDSPTPEFAAYKKVGDWEFFTPKAGYRCGCGKEATRCFTRPWKAWCDDCPVPGVKPSWRPKLEWFTEDLVRRGSRRRRRRRARNDAFREEVARRGLAIVPRTASALASPPLVPQEKHDVAQPAPPAGDARESPVEAAKQLIGNGGGVTFHGSRSVSFGSLAGFRSLQEDAQRRYVQFIGGFLHIPEDEARKAIERAIAAGSDVVEVTW